MKKIVQLLATSVWNGIGTATFLCCVAAASVCTGQQLPDSRGFIGVPGITKEISQSIWVMYEGRDHVYWFGSNGNGAYRYDGKTLVRYTTAEGLCSDQIRGIQADSMGNVYFDTPKGISKYDGKRFVKLKPEHGTSNQWMLQAGDLWFKGNGDVVGAYRYDGSNLYKLNFSELDGRKYDRECAVYSIYRDYNGHLWFGTEKGGVARYNGKKLEWIVEDELKTLSDGRVPAIRSVLRDADGWYWLSHIAYRYRVSTGAGGRMVYQKARYVTDLQRAKMQLPYFTSAVVDGQTIWMTTYNEGVWRCDSGILTQYTLTYYGRKVLPVSVYKDRGGTIWVTTDNAGIYVLQNNEFVRFTP